MSIATEITRLQNAKAAIKTAIEGKGVTVPDATLMDGMAALIDAIEAGGGGSVEPFSEVLTGTVTFASNTTDWTLPKVDNIIGILMAKNNIGFDNDADGIAYIKLAKSALEWSENQDSGVVFRLHTGINSLVSDGRCYVSGTTLTSSTYKFSGTYWYAIMYGVLS